MTLGKQNVSIWGSGYLPDGSCERGIFGDVIQTVEDVNSWAARLFRR